MYPLKQFFLLFLLSQACNVNGQQGEWTWMSGDSTYDSPAVFGTLGVSSPLNTPGGTYGPYIWIDDSSNLWIYGGLTYAQGTMWKYSITTNEWTWMST
ncbi:MAG: hypothetical protein IPG39_11830 [Bacteroidetes bacterium]|nr:hypothetical protein [Bacteroidota bacterium]